MNKNYRNHQFNAFGGMPANATYLQKTIFYSNNLFDKLQLLFSTFLQQLYPLLPDASMILHACLRGRLCSRRRPRTERKRVCIQDYFCLLKKSGLARRIA